MASTALLVMDVQQGIVDRHADDVEDLPRLAGAIGTARRAGVRIIYVVVGFRAGYPGGQPAQQDLRDDRGLGADGRRRPGARPSLPPSGRIPATWS
jgi:nicotinamidase-related amidase